MADDPVQDPDASRAATAARPGQRPGFGSRLSVWAFSIVAIVIAPLFPVFVEGVKNNWEIRAESYLLTAAVLAVGFGFSSEGNLFRAAYALIFLLAVGYDFRPDDVSAATAGPRLMPEIGRPIDIVGAGGWILRHPAPDLMFMVALLHGIERFMWHVVLDRRFPDWLKGS